MNGACSRVKSCKNRPRGIGAVVVCILCALERDRRDAQERAARLSHERALAVRTNEERLARFKAQVLMDQQGASRRRRHVMDGG